MQAADSVNDFLYKPEGQSYLPYAHANYPVVPLGKPFGEFKMDELQDKYKARLERIESAKTKSHGYHADKLVAMMHAMDYEEDQKAHAGRLLAYNMAGVDPQDFHVKHKAAHDAKTLTEAGQRAQDEKLHKEYLLRADRRQLETGSRQSIQKIIPSDSEERHDLQLMNGRNISDATRAYKHHVSALLEMKLEEQRHIAMNDKLMRDEVGFAQGKYMGAAREARVTGDVSGMPKSADEFNKAMEMAEVHKATRAKQFEVMEKKHTQAFQQLEAVERRSIQSTTTYLQRFNTIKKKEMETMYKQQANSVGGKLEPPAEHKARKKKEKKAKAGEPSHSDQQLAAVRKLLSAKKWPIS